MGRGQTGAFFRALFFLAILCGAGCAQYAFVSGVQPGVSVLESTADSPDVKGLRSTQQIDLFFADKRETLVGVLEMYVNRTALAVVSPTGLFLFSVEQTADSIEVERHADLPSLVDPIAILKDVQLVNWPQDALSQIWGTRVKFDVNGDDRVIMRRGRPLKRVQYLQASNEWRQAQLIDEQYNYRIHVHKLTEEEI